MKKLFKIIGFSLLGLVLLVLAAAIIVPVFFKDDIQRAVDEAIQDYVQAKVDYKKGSFSLSILRSFPDVTIGIEDISIVNQAPFDGDTLISVKDLALSFDLKSLFGSRFQINRVYMGQPRVFGQVNELGVANWDIAIKDTLPDTTSSAFMANIDDWEIENGYISYHDEVFPLLATFEGLNHRGSGTLSEITEILTTTQAAKAYLEFGGITYLNDVQLDAITNLELEGNTYTFKENSFKLNDFGLHFDGSTTIGDGSIGLDLTIDAPKNNFKNLLSLIPSVFLEGYSDVEANGEFKFDGKIKGEYTDLIYPAFDIKLSVKDGDFKHPKLPKRISAVNFDLNLLNQSGALNQTTIDAKNINIVMGQNVIAGRLLLQGLDHYHIDLDLDAKVKLDEIKDFYPLQGTQLKGNLVLDATAKGLVDLDNQRFPVVNGMAKLSNGYLKTQDVNLPIEQLNFNARFQSTGTTAGSEVDVQNLSLLLDGDRFGGQIKVTDFDQFIYDLNLMGTINLSKLLKIVPLESVAAKGTIEMKDFKSSGSLQAIQQEKYGSLKTSGSALLNDISYTDTEYLPNGLDITKAHIQFEPSQIKIHSYQGYLGKSDVSITGKLTNYMGYLFGSTDTVLGGQMTMKSNSFDIDPFLAEDQTSATTPAESEGVATVPEDLYFVIDSEINLLNYDSLKMSNFKGELIIERGVVKMKEVAFQALGAFFLASGSYDPRVPNHPKYDFDLKIDKMQIQEAFAYFNVVKLLAPLAHKIEGFVDTDIKMSGELSKDYLPDFNTLNMTGNLSIIEAMAKVTDIKMLSGIIGKTKLKDVEAFRIAKEKINVEVKNGKLWVSPFVMKSANGAFLTSQLNTGLANDQINHHMNLDAPAASLKSGLAALGLDPGTVGDRISIDFDVLGTRKNPKIDLKKSVSNSLKTQVEEGVKTRVEDAKADLEKKAREELEQARKEAEQRAKAQAEKIKQEAQDKAKLEADKARQQAKNKLEDAIKDKGLTVPWKK